ncbi:DMT family transporter [Siccirubricoccus sp. KC 17139]|uniref:DMT family transporter n=1 Tax=Siccirubricoccus soli TaxID=2899147 RepID=A0ABT1D3N8_9PROT|nr:DMT family transporter [Siccirubricoccus soli]MCO6415590.1 DMT family transporter [Siccirubricoccus soli]MCP2681722.1 DMT family transporter [Siccirubricoccus soli]
MPRAPGGARTGQPGYSAAPTGEEAVRGLAQVALGYGVISAADAAVKWVLPEVGPAAALAWRGAIGALLVFLMARGRGLVPVNRRLLAIRSALHCAISITWYCAWVLGVSLADSYAVAAASPLIMTLMAIPLLGEKVGWRRWTSTIIGFCGVLFMLQPGGELWRWESAMLLVATVAMALTRIWTRVLTQTDGPHAMAFWLLLAHVPAGLLFLPFEAFWPPSGPPPLLPSLVGMAALLIFGFCNAVAQMLFARGFALAPISAIAPFEYTPLLWGIGLGYLLWGEVPAWTTLGGAAVVIGAGLYNVHRERVRRAEERARRQAGEAEGTDSERPAAVRTAEAG